LPIFLGAGLDENLGEEFPQVKASFGFRKVKPKLFVGDGLGDRLEVTGGELALLLLELSDFVLEVVLAEVSTGLIENALLDQLGQLIDEGLFGLELLLEAGLDLFEGRGLLGLDDFGEGLADGLDGLFKDGIVGDRRTFGLFWTMGRSQIEIFLGTASPGNLCHG
jgi:hypothetical protein